MSDDLLLSASKRQALVAHLERLERYRLDRADLEAPHNRKIDTFTNLFWSAQGILRDHSIPPRDRRRYLANKAYRALEKSISFLQAEKKAALFRFDHDHKPRQGPHEKPSELAGWIREQIANITHIERELFATASAHSCVVWVVWRAGRRLDLLDSVGSIG